MNNFKEGKEVLWNVSNDPYPTSYMVGVCKWQAGNSSWGACVESVELCLWGICTFPFLRLELNLLDVRIRSQRFQVWASTFKWYFCDNLFLFWINLRHSKSVMKAMSIKPHPSISLLGLRFWILTVALNPIWRYSLPRVKLVPGE